MSLDKPIDKFIEDQKNKNTFKDTKNCKFADEFLNSKNESRRIEEISVFIKKTGSLDNAIQDFLLA